IHVNIVAPGLVETDMGIRLAKATQGVSDIRELDKSMPFGHVCQPSDISDVVRYLVSDGAGYLTGQKINVDGGGQ
ncbi:MAG: SDR family oxidoreductase, partial [Anaerolineaceae bacterium]